MIGRQTFRPSTYRRPISPWHAVMRAGRVPDAVPVLSSGRHRSAKRGACLMEFVSFLAGEKFSDAPACTDPTLAIIARAVNDYSTDGARQRLAVLASDLTTAGPTGRSTQQAMARRCLLTAIDRATGDRRRVLIVALLGLERAAAGDTKGWRDESLGLDAELALLDSTTDLDHARQRVAALPVALDQQHRRGLALAIELAISTVQQESSDPDEQLYRLLVSCLGDATTPYEEPGVGVGRHQGLHRPNAH